MRTSFGYHIIKIDDIKQERERSFEEVKEEIVKSLTEIHSAELAHEKGLTLMDQMPYDAKLKDYGAEHALEAKQTDFFDQSVPIPGIGGKADLRKSLFTLREGETSDLIELNGTYYIFQVAERRDAHVPESSEVIGKVRERLIAHLAALDAKKRAEGFLAEVRRGSAWDALVEKEKLSTEQTDFFSRYESVGTVGSEQELKEMVFRLGKDNPYPEEVFENEKGAYVFRWDSYQAIDEKKFAEEMDRYRFSLMSIKQNRAFERWLADLREKAEIEILMPVTEG